MFKSLTILAALTLVLLCSELTQAQFGGLQVQVGGYGNGLRVGGFGYGNGFNNGYGNAYGNSYGLRNGYGYTNGYGNSYGNSYRSGYGSTIQPSAIYLGGRVSNGYGYSNYPRVNYSYGAPRYFNSSMRRYGSRRF